MKTIKKIIRKTKNGDLKKFFIKSKYLKYIKKFPIKENAILIEFFWGKPISGNGYYILKELLTNNEFRKYQIYLPIENKFLNDLKLILEKNDFLDVNIVIVGSKDYYEIMATAKYLFNCGTFLPFFVKRDEQIYINTWHGTPLKTLGKYFKTEPSSTGNTQRNFIVADYLLSPNLYTKEKILEGYMLENLSKAKFLLGGYPRNTAFFDEEKKALIKESLDLENKQIIAYMPTWRGIFGKNDPKFLTYISYYLLEIDKLLSENQIIYTQFHPSENKVINFNMFKNIKKFPKGYETYEFLNIADCLITDYSSVFFDYVNTRKKIILFTFDKEEYLKDRGLYLDLNDLPFPKVENVNDLMNEINTPINYDDEDFINDFCLYDNENAAKQLCEHVILNRPNVIEEKIVPNNKENVLIYASNIDLLNGITSSLINMLKLLDTTKANFYIAFTLKRYGDIGKKFISDLPSDVNYIPIHGGMKLNFFQKVAFSLYRRNYINKLYFKINNSAYEHEIKRLFGNIKFSSVIQYVGYDLKEIILFSYFKCNKMIYVHNDMIGEIKTRKNQHKNTLVHAYKNYDHVIPVGDDIVEPTKKLCKRHEKITVINNPINYKQILSKANDELRLDSQTKISVPLEELFDVLENKNIKKFITIGRFSPEKGHPRLINNFNKLWLENDDKNIYLIILGSHGVEYDKTLKLANSVESKDNIIIIKSLSNPFPLLKKCDYFVLTSYYEGLPTVIFEADILKKPIISTDVNGPRAILSKYNGHLVENSDDGIYQGLKLLLTKKISLMNINYEEYNNQAVTKLEKLLKL